MHWAGYACSIWSCQRMSEDKDQAHELIIEAVEIGAKLVDHVKIKDEEEGI